MSGSGNSDGEYISLGWYEKYDVEVVVDYLKNSEKYSKICLWGRSMGAVTALMYCSENPKIACAIYDSPFSSLVKLARELASNKTGLPDFIINFALSFIRDSIK